MSKEKISIVYAPDENYAGIMTVSMISALKNAKDEDIEFVILYSDLNPNTIDKINLVKKIRECTLRFVKVDRTEFSDFPLCNWVTMSTWFRTKVADLCPDIDKILYLDCDTMVLDSLKELWTIDLGGNYAAAVNYNKTQKHLKTKSKTYFNAGVILFNCKTWRDEKLFEKIKDFAINKKDIIKYADQDVLNYCIDDKKADLGREYNYRENYMRRIKPTYIENPKIVHFIGPNPNRFDCMHSMKHIWVEYAKLSPFYEYFVNQNIYNIIKMYKKLKFDAWKFEFLSKYSFGKMKLKYRKKHIIHSKLMKSLEY